MVKTRQFSRVQFQVEAPIGHGQSIYVTGNGPALGDNDALSGVALYTTPADYPRWSSDWGKCLRKGGRERGKECVFLEAPIGHGQSIACVCDGQWFCPR